MFTNFDDECERVPFVPTWKLDGSMSQAYDALSNSPFVQLPTEILIRIFRLLSIRDLENISLVCRYFKVIADQDDIWKSKCNPSIEIPSKSFKEIYMDWIYGKDVRKRKLNKIDEEYKKTRDHIPCLLSSHCCQTESIHLSLETFTEIEVSIDTNRTVIALIAYLEKASEFFGNYCRTTVIEQMILRYYRFLQLKAWYPNDRLISTLDIEIIWQTHLIRPQMYRDDCYRLFHRIIDHSLIIDDNEDQCKEERFNRTCSLYEQHFGEQYCSLISSDDDENNTWIGKQSVLHNIRCSIPAYSYWDKTQFEFSSNLPNDYKNPFSFVETDITLDSYWFQLYFSDVYEVGLTIMIINAYSQENALHLALKQLNQSYKRFLYLGAKYSTVSEHNFIHPTYAIDIIWHAHMQEPLKYADDCQHLLGRLIDHVPWSSSITANQITESNMQMNEIWQKEFDRNMESDHLE